MVSRIIRFGTIFVAMIGAFTSPVHAQTQNSWVIPNRVPNATPRSGTITQGGAWQQIAPANPVRIRLFIQNYCSASTEGIPSAESLFMIVSPTQPTSMVGALEFTPCGTYSSDGMMISTSNVWFYAATTGHIFGAWEW